MATDLILVSGLNQIKPRDSLQLRLWMDASKATDGAVKQRDFKSVLSNWGGSSPHTVLVMGEGLHSGGDLANTVSGKNWASVFSCDTATPNQLTGTHSSFCGSGHGKKETISCCHQRQRIISQFLCMAWKAGLEFLGNIETANYLKCAPLRKVASSKYRSKPGYNHGLSACTV